MLYRKMGTAHWQMIVLVIALINLEPSVVAVTNILHNKIESTSKIIGYRALQEEPPLVEKFKESLNGKNLVPGVQVSHTIDPLERSNPSNFDSGHGNPRQLSSEGSCYLANNDDLNDTREKISVQNPHLPQQNHQKTKVLEACKSPITSIRFEEKCSTDASTNYLLQLEGGKPKTLKRTQESQNEYTSSSKRHKGHGMYPKELQEISQLPQSTSYEDKLVGGRYLYFKSASALQNGDESSERCWKDIISGTYIEILSQAESDLKTLGSIHWVTIVHQRNNYPSAGIMPEIKQIMDGTLMNFIEQGHFLNHEIVFPVARVLRHFLEKQPNHIYKKKIEKVLELVYICALNFFQRFEQEIKNTNPDKLHVNVEKYFMDRSKINHPEHLITLITSTVQPWKKAWIYKFYLSSISNMSVYNKVRSHPEILAQMEQGICTIDKNDVKIALGNLENQLGLEKDLELKKAIILFLVGLHAYPRSEIFSIKDARKKHIVALLRKLEPTLTNEPTLKRAIHTVAPPPLAEQFRNLMAGSYNFVKHFLMSHTYSERTV
ncbi:hypothetical protein CROQUDRAFT_136816 [Cronartium quercuum f. sp. fusiforme G11]|uniref:Uncharacterized protein n=1 Tax=Cronartium quercuum f. sp. fusiforme G11 TaxID=708437 RepID=A0A9P6NAI3_9BASI|nr:hypothetical protein CROQUDRAFT_136816 [Cronartium quercuum f. sp. fusiforme G11]